MNGLRRVLVTIGGLCLVGLGIFSVACLASRSVPAYWLAILQHFFYGGHALWLLLFAALLLVVGIFCIYVGLHRDRAPQMARVTTNEGGVINISLGAIETLCKQAAGKVPGVVETKTRIRVVNEGIAIYLHVTVPPDINIPETASALQQEVKNHLETMSGVKVLEVKVLISNVEPLQQAGK